MKVFYPEIHKDSYYQGGLISGLRQGFGIFQERDTIYQGNFVNNRKCGKGELFRKQISSDYSNPMIYEGNWENDFYHGSGTLYFHQTSNSQGFKNYTGNFTQGKMNDSQGRMEFQDGSVYTGNFIDGKITGYGKLMSKEGNIFEGSFIDGLKEGPGFYRTWNGKELTGEWVNGSLQVGVMVAESLPINELVDCEGVYKTAIDQTQIRRISQIS
jgi:hypothetical protein